MRNGTTKLPNRLMKVPAKRAQAAGGRPRTVCRRLGGADNYLARRTAASWAWASI